MRKSPHKKYEWEDNGLVNLLLKQQEQDSRVKNEKTNVPAKKYIMVVPCYNEEEVIDLFANALTAMMDEVKPEVNLNVLFVNDGSRDKTLTKMENINIIDSRFGYISFSRNFGKEAAMLAGLTEAYESGADYIGVMDVDMQDPPHMILDMVDMLEKEENGYDCVAVRRTTRDGEPPIRSFFARTFYKIMNKISNTNMEDGARDFRIMSREMTKAILDIKDKCRFSKGIFGYVGYNIHWLDYENVERAAGVTKWSFYKLSLYALDGITAFTESPLRTASLFAGLYGCLQFALYIYQIIHSIVHKGFSLLLLLGSEYLTRSVLFVVLAIAGLYMVRIAKETKDRPNYVIAKRNLPQ